LKLLVAAEVRQADQALKTVQARLLQGLSVAVTVALPLTPLQQHAEVAVGRAVTLEPVVTVIPVTVAAVTALEAAGVEAVVEVTATKPELAAGSACLVSGRTASVEMEALVTLILPPGVVTETALWTQTTPPPTILF
jgi:hypothetical protein